MPEHIRALIVILFLSTNIFVFARQPAGEIIRSAGFSRRRNLWFALTLVAFLAQDIWIYILIAGFLVALARTHEPNPVALFFLLLFVVPVFKLPTPKYRKN